MFITFNMILEIIISALDNTLSIIEYKITKVLLKHDGDNQYTLKIVIQDKQYNNDIVRISLSLTKNQRAYKIDDVYLMLSSSKEGFMNITPFYFEGLNELRISLDRVLSGFYISECEVVDYEEK